MKRLLIVVLMGAMPLLNGCIAYKSDGRFVDRGLHALKIWGEELIIVVALIILWGIAVNHLRDKNVQEMIRKGRGGAHTILCARLFSWACGFVLTIFVFAMFAADFRVDFLPFDEPVGFNASELVEDAKGLVGLDDDASDDGQTNSSPLVERLIQASNLTDEQKADFIARLNADGTDLDALRKEFAQAVADRIGEKDFSEELIQASNLTDEQKADFIARLNADGTDLDALRKEFDKNVAKKRAQKFWVFGLCSVVFVIAAIALWHYRKNRLVWISLGLAVIAATGLVFFWDSLVPMVLGLFQKSLFYEIIFATAILIGSTKLFLLVSRPCNLAPQESEESMVPYAFDPSKEDPKISKEGESLAEYQARRQRTINALKEENKPYRKYRLRWAMISVILMALWSAIFIFLNPLMVLAFFGWATYIGWEAFRWLKSSSEKKFFEEYCLWKLSLWLGAAYVMATAFSWLLGIGHLGWDILIFATYAILMIASYFLGCVLIVPIRRRWVYTVFNKVVKAEKLIIYTPDKERIEEIVSGLHNDKVRQSLKDALRRLNVGGTNWLDVGINVGVLSMVFVNVVDIISNYFMVVEATKQTRLLPTKGLVREDLDIKTKSAGTVSFFFRFFYLLGVDPLVSSRLSIGEREEAVPMAGRVIEGHIADRAKALDFDQAMLYPFFDEDTPLEDGEQPDEYASLMVKLNTEFLILAGAYVLKFNVIDRDPADEIQKAMDLLTAKVYERDQAAVDAEKRIEEGRGVGGGRAAEIEKLAEALDEPKNKAAMEMLIRLTGAENASIHEILRRLSGNAALPAPPSE